MSEEVPDYVAIFCAEKGVDRTGLRFIPPAVLETAVGEIWPETAERIRAHVAIGRAASKHDGEEDNTLKTYFSERERREHEPWRIAAARAKTQTDAIEKAFGEKGAWDTLSAAFLAKAKAGLFSPLEALCLQYLVLGGGSGDNWPTFLLASVLVNVPPAARLAVHNWAVAAEMPEALREANGPAIAALNAPLFPYGRGFESLNARLLASVSGGGPASALFAPSLSGGLWEQPSRRPPPYPTGAGALAIRGPGGQQTAELETTPLEAELATIKAMVWGLGGRGRGRGRGGYYNPPQTFMPNARPQQQQQHYNQQPQQHQQHQQPHQQQQQHQQPHHQQQQHTKNQ